MRQKFRRFAFVHVTRNDDPSRAHFETDFDAIIEGTYSQLYGGRDVDSYSLYQLSDGKVVNALAWYHEAELRLLPDQDPEKAEELIEDFNFEMEEDP